MTHGCMAAGPVWGSSRAPAGVLTDCASVDYRRRDQLRPTGTAPPLAASHPDRTPPSARPRRPPTQRLEGNAPPRFVRLALHPLSTSLPTRLSSTLSTPE